MPLASSSVAAAIRSVAFVRRMLAFADFCGLAVAERGASFEDAVDFRDRADSRDFFTKLISHNQTEYSPCGRQTFNRRKECADVQYIPVGSLVAGVRLLEVELTAKIELDRLFLTFCGN